jgi:hypothetical protein
MSVSKKYKRNRNHRKKRNSRKLKRAGDRVSPVNIKGEQFNHIQNYDITKNAVSNIIGENNIRIWDNELKDTEPKNEPTYNIKENLKDMVQYFPDAMYNVENENIQNYDGLIEDEKSWIQFYAKDTDGEVIIEDDYYVMKNQTRKSKYDDLVAVTNEFVDIHGLLIQNFRKKFGIMFGSDEEAKEDRELYVKSLLWAYSFNPEEYLPTFNRKFKTYTNFGSTNRYDDQGEYNEDKQKFKDYLDNQVDYKNMTEDKSNELMNQWTHKNRGTYWSNKYNPLKYMFNSKQGTPARVGGRKTRKRRKFKKSKKSKRKITRRRR